MDADQLIYFGDVIVRDDADRLFAVTALRAAAWSAVGSCRWATKGRANPLAATFSE